MEKNEQKYKTLSRLPAYPPSHGSSSCLTGASVYLPYYITLPSYPRVFLTLDCYNYLIPYTLTSSLTSPDLSWGRDPVHWVGLSSCHEPEISDTYLNFLFMLVLKFSVYIYKQKQALPCLLSVPFDLKLHFITLYL